MPSKQGLKIAQLILAAGTSSRMGEPKQLLPWDETTLIEHAIVQSIETQKVTTYVVLGANYEAVFDQIKHLPVKIIHNKNWQMGMGKSIQTGVQNIVNKDVNYDAILISLIDQPLITSAYYKKLINKLGVTSDIIIASDLGGHIGVPAIFSKTIFEELLQLENDFGARHIIKKYSLQITTIALDDLGKDIDTKEQYQQIIKNTFYRESK